MMVLISAYRLIICVLFIVFKKGNGNIIQNYLKLLANAGSVLSWTVFSFSYSKQSEVDRNMTSFDLVP